MDRTGAETTLYCATGNPGKVREYARAAARYGCERVDIGMLPGIADICPPEETGATFAENAALKAMYYSQRADDLVFADDSGLCVEALGGAPGVYSARYAGLGASDEVNLRLLLSNMQGHSVRAAHFVCVIVLAQAGKVLASFEGTVKGEILHQSRGEGGFGYDPVFWYPPIQKSFAEIDVDKKFTLSHRGTAFRQLLQHIAGPAR